MASNGRFDFTATIEKAETADGRLYITAVASDSGVDKHDDRFSEKAISSMATQAISKRLPLLPTHFDTFSIGHSVHGEARRVSNMSQFVVKVELKPEYPQAMELYKEIEAGGTDKQLSIGGKLKLKDPQAVEWEPSADGRFVQRVLNAIELDHIAVTRENQAANPRTSFLDTIKALYDDAVDEVRKAHEPQIQVILMKLDYDRNWRPTAEDLTAVTKLVGEAVTKTLCVGFEKEPHLGLLARVADGAVVKSLGALLGAAEVVVRDPAAVGLSDADDRREAADALLRSFREFKVASPRPLVELAAGEGTAPWGTDVAMAWKTYVDGIAAPGTESKPAEAAKVEPPKAEPAKVEKTDPPATEDTFQKCIDSLKGVDGGTLTDIQKNVLRDIAGPLLRLAGFSVGDRGEKPDDKNTKADPPATVEVDAMKGLTERLAALEALIAGLTSKLDTAASAASTFKSDLGAVEGRLKKVEEMEGSSAGEQARRTTAGSPDPIDTGRINGVLGLAKFSKAFARPRA